MTEFNSGQSSDRYYDGDKNSDLDPLFCHAYGRCDDSCLLFGCAFEEAEDMRNWDLEESENDNA